MTTANPKTRDGKSWRQSLSRRLRSLTFPEIISLLFVFYGLSSYLFLYLYNRSIWMDEANLALSILHKPLARLMTTPLEGNQAAPLGFIFLTKVLVMAFGGSEYVLRLLPLAAGMGSILLFWRLLRQHTDAKTTAVALILFVLSPLLLRYATEFKPYYSDIFTALAIVFFSMKSIQGKLDEPKAAALGVLGGAAVWFSFPALFMLGGAGMALLTRLLWKKSFREVRALGISFFIWGVSFTAYYFLSLRSSVQNAALHEFWGPTFLPPLSFSLRSQLAWADSLIFTIYDAGAIDLALLGGILFVCGACSLFRKNKALMAMGLIPFFLAILASGMKRYPLTGRLFLFYVPFMYLFIAEGVVWVLEKVSIFRKLGYVLTLLILLPPMPRALKSIPPGCVYAEQLRPVLRYVHDNIREGDMIYVYYGASPAFRYYAPSLKFDRRSCIIGTPSRESWEGYVKELSRLRGRGRVWFVFTHVRREGGKSEEAFMIHYLDSIGKRLDTARSVHATAYLYVLPGGDEDGAASGGLSAERKNS